jgi:hypothetical protein
LADMKVVFPSADVAVTRYKTTKSAGSGDSPSDNARIEWDVVT